MVPALIYFYHVFQWNAEMRGSCMGVTRYFWGSTGSISKTFSVWKGECYLLILSYPPVSSNPVKCPAVLLRTFWTVHCAVHRLEQSKRSNRTCPIGLPPNPGLFSFGQLVILMYGCHARTLQYSMPCRPARQEAGRKEPWPSSLTSKTRSALRNTPNGVTIAILTSVMYWKFKLESQFCYIMHILF